MPHRLEVGSGLAMRNNGGRAGKEAHLEFFVGVEMQDLELFERAGQLGDAARGQAAHQRDRILSGLECSTSVASVPKDERAAVCSRLPSAAGRGRLSAHRERLRGDLPHPLHRRAHCTLLILRCPRRSSTRGIRGLLQFQTPPLFICKN